MRSCITCVCSRIKITNEVFSPLLLRSAPSYMYIEINRYAVSTLLLRVLCRVCVGVRCPRRVVYSNMFYRFLDHKRFKERIRFF